MLAKHSFDDINGVIEAVRMPGRYRPGEVPKRLVDRRDDLVQQRTATVRRLPWRVRELGFGAARAALFVEWSVQHPDVVTKSYVRLGRRFV